MYRKGGAEVGEKFTLLLFSKVMLGSRMRGSSKIASVHETLCRIITEGNL